MTIFDHRPDHRLRLHDEAPGRGIKEVENGDAKEEFQKEPEDEKMEDAENAPKAEPDKLEEKDIPEKDADEKDEAKPAPEPELPNGTATIDSDEEVGGKDCLGDIYGT